jgi:hypothetical protein
MEKRHITTLSTARSGHNFVLANIYSWKLGEFAHHNLENIEPILLMPNHLNHGGMKVIIWRDFDDWLASLIMMSYRNRPTRNWEDVPKYIRNACRVYFAIMQEVKTPHYFHADHVVHYDKFAGSLKYRKDLCKAMGGTYSEKAIDFVPAQGGGSSFEKREMNGRGSKMKTQDRAKMILETDHKDFFLKIMKEYGQT